MRKSSKKVCWIELHNQVIEELFGDILVPVEEVVEMKSGKKTITERRLYPGYVLVQMDMNDDSWHLVKNTPKVSTFIGGNGQKANSYKRYRGRY